MKSMKCWAVLMLLSVVCLSSFSCASRTPVTEQPTSGTDKKLSKFSFIEEGKLVTLIVDVHSARDQDGRMFMPLEIAVSNNGQRMLRLTRESFTLIDGEGNRYPVVPPTELAGKDPVELGRRMNDLPGIVFNMFSVYTRVRSDLSPLYQNIVFDLVELPKFHYMIDFIYFPTPATGVRDQYFELVLEAPELEDPVFVKFVVL